MKLDLRNIDIDAYNENSKETYMYNYNTEEVEISNNSSHICLNEAISYYTECNRKIIESNME